MLTSFAVLATGYLPELIGLISEGLGETLYMILASVLITYLFGLPLGVVLVTSAPGHILENPKLNKFLGTIVNVVRSIPFIILLFTIGPFTRMLVGTTIGTTAAVVPLVIGAIPFVGRMVETSLKEVDKGVVEAALSMGASPGQIISKVLIPEALPSLVLGATITTITLVGYSAMAGVVGGGGLGDLAVRYGYYRYKADVMVVTVVILVVLVQVVQTLGDVIAARIRRK
jgi:D-methionine transport system permease protein